tara:strand:- start:528 stop:644 length:117 start_codon:yes stop_codon:yes gene_type:complete
MGRLRQTEIYEDVIMAVAIKRFLRSDERNVTTAKRFQK